MAISSSSPIGDIEAQYDDNADYREVRSVAKAQLFIQACRILVRRYQTSVAVDGGASFSRSVALVQGQLTEASEWFEANSPVGQNGGTTVPDFRRARC